MSARMLRLALAGCAVLLGAGCAIQAGAYTPSTENAERLRAAGPARVAVGEVRAAPDLPTAARISVRLGTMESPHGANFVDYLAEALRRDLALARWLDRDSSVRIEATLLANDFDASGVATGTGRIEARFVVTRAGVPRYDRVHRNEHQWESSFAANVAVPLAQQNYPRLVEGLLARLFADPEFAAATR